jgi:hypothetical protein
MVPKQIFLSSFLKHEKIQKQIQKISKFTLHKKFSKKFPFFQILSKKIVPQPTILYLEIGII